MNQNRYNMRKRKRKAKDDTSSDEVLFPQKEKKIQIKLEKSQVDEFICLMHTIEKKNELIRQICKEKDMLVHQLHVKQAEIETEITQKGENETRKKEISIKIYPIKRKQKAKDDTSSDKETSTSEEDSDTEIETDKQFGCKRRVLKKKNECLYPLQMDYRNYGNIPGLKENYKMMFEKMKRTDALSKFYSLNFFFKIYFFLFLAHSYLKKISIKEEYKWLTETKNDNKTLSLMDHLMFIQQQVSVNTDFLCSSLNYIQVILCGKLCLQTDCFWHGTHKMKIVRRGIKNR